MVFAIHALKIWNKSSVLHQQNITTWVHLTTKMCQKKLIDSQFGFFKLIFYVSEEKKNL